MRLIDADALIEKLEAWKKEAERRDATINYAFASAIIAQVNAEPTIEERKRGRWKRRIVDSGFNADWVCSECKYRVKTDFVNYNFCPHCGAKMEGTDETD